MTTSHCWEHGDEPLTNGEPYIVCFECGHVFQSEQELVDAHNAILDEIGEHLAADHVSTGVEAFCCPVCIHDF